MFPLNNSGGARKVKTIIAENKTSHNRDAIQRKRKSWNYMCSDLPDELIVTTDKRKRVVGKRNRFKSKPKSRSATTLGMKVCKMTTDPLLCAESRRSLSESRALSGGALLVTLPLGKRLVFGVRAEKQHYHRSLLLFQDNNIYTEQMPVPIRRRNIHQTTLKPIFYWRCNIDLFFLKKKKKSNVHKMRWGTDEE